MIVSLLLLCIVIVLVLLLSKSVSSMDVICLICNHGMDQFCMSMLSIMLVSMRIQLLLHIQPCCNAVR